MSGYTKVGNWLFDVVMPAAKPNTFKVVAAVVRCTDGWNKKQDKISLSRFQQLTGIRNKTNLIRAIQDAIASGYIERVKVGLTFAYRTTGTEAVQDQYRNSTSTGTETVPAGSTETVHTTVQDQITLLNQNGDSGAVFSLYEQEIGMMSKVIADQIDDAVEEFGAGFVKEAIEIASNNNVRKWSYIDGILKRWRANGKQDKRREPETVKQAEGGGIYL